jgi:hypothetical protein
MPTERSRGLDARPLLLSPTGRGAAWLARLSGGPEASLAMPTERSRGLDGRPLLLSPNGAWRSLVSAVVWGT